jgi:endonuclease/exonuclease/phosphatase family metal-dependent hydrolase
VFVRFAFISLFLFSIAQGQTYLGSAGPIYQGSYATNKNQIPQTIKVVSYNISFSQNLGEVITTLESNEKLRKADILLIQEIVGSPDGSNNTAAVLAKRLGLNYVFIPGQIHPKLQKDYGSAILSPWPLDEIQKIVLPGKHLRHRTQRAVVSARVTIGNHAIRSYSVHLENMFLDTFSADEKSRFFQIVTLLSQVPKNEQVVVGGDFNAINPSGLTYLLSMFWANHFTRASSLLPSENKIPIGIDHIFTRGTRVVNYGTVYDFSGSDHAPVWADLKL